MPHNVKFPPSVEIKRAIAAAERAGIQIGSVEIQSRKIIIVARVTFEEKPTQLTYLQWKQLHGAKSER